MKTCIATNILFYKSYLNTKMQSGPRKALIYLPKFVHSLQQKSNIKHTDERKKLFDSHALG